jgi:hypothetical protein
MSWVTNLVKIPRHAIVNCPTVRFHVWLVHKEMLQKMQQLALQFVKILRVLQRTTVGCACGTSRVCSVTCKQFDVEDISNEIC